jgi:hypothetical protein
VTTAGADMHSGMKGGSVQNANHALVQLLSGLWETHGKPSLLGWGSKVRREDEGQWARSGQRLSQCQRCCRRAVLLTPGTCLPLSPLPACKAELPACDGARLLRPREGDEP